jgi:guanine deaminase
MNHGSPDYYREKSVKESLIATHELFKHIDDLNSPLVKPILTPRFALSCTPDLLCKLGHITKHNTHLAIQTHISENKKEVQDVLEMYKDWGVKTYAEVYDKAGLLTDRTILGHAVHLERSEMELIKQRGAGVSHCPTSNFNLNSGMARVGEMIDLGIKARIFTASPAYTQTTNTNITYLTSQVGLGTDVSGGFSPSMLRTIQDTCFTSKMIAVYPLVPSHNEHERCQEKSHRAVQFTNQPLRIPALVYLATVGGAQLCHLEHTIGTLEPGKSFDAILASVRPESGNAGIWTGPEEFNGHVRNVAEGEEDAEAQSAILTEETKRLEAWLERFLFGGDERNVEKVFVQGRLIGGRVSNLRDNGATIVTDM